MKRLGVGQVTFWPPLILILILTAMWATVSVERDRRCRDG